MKYIYPFLPAVKTTPLFRIGGNGLANCLFVYAKAIISAKKYNAKIIAPTWFNLSIGTYLRHQADKRHYLGLFNTKNELTGLSRILKIWFGEKITDKQAFEKADSGILIEKGIYDFFEPLRGHSECVREYIIEHVAKDLLKQVDSYDFTQCIAVHVRLGDFAMSRRVPTEWYLEKMKDHADKHILIFSDGTDEELKPYLEIPNAEKAFYGGAIQDIIAMSRCEYIIGSDSSFSAWAAYLGQTPCCFYRLQFGDILDNIENQRVETH